ncbi:MAG TPA: TonB-dependent receptor [Bryobacteraceae bacterium]|nr:TonB-dependent receptor [Bryobacteraceae bacterium]
MKFLLLLVAAVSAGAAVLSVRIVDPGRQAIPAATVSLISQDGEAQALTTDSAGSCRFTAAPGHYLLSAVAAGFDASVPQQVEVLRESDSPVTISLGIAQVRSTVVVTASGTPQTTDEVSKALTVVDSSTIEQRADKTVAEALADVPGLLVQQLGGPLSFVSFKIRGLRDTDTAVLVDGMRLRDASGTQGDASGVLEDLLIADTGRIEVLRGTGSSLYGTDATGGVVNIVTGEGGGHTRGSITADGGSLGAARGAAHLSGGFDQDRIQYSVGLTHWNVTRGIDNDSPARNTSGQGQVTFRLSSIAFLTARVYAGDSFSFIRLSPMPVGNVPSSGIINAVPLSLAQQHLYESGTPLEDLNPGNANFIADQFDPDSTRVGHFFTGALRFVVRPSDRLSFTAQYQNVRTTRDYGDGPAGPGYFQPAGTNLSDYFGRIQTANARLDYSPSHWQHLDAGYEFEDEDFQNSLIPPPSTAAFYGNVSQLSHAIFAQDQLQFDGGRLQFSAGYRAQFFSLDTPFFQPAAGAPFAGQNFAAPPTAQTGDLSAAYTLRRSGTKFRAHVGRGYRAPSLYERFGTYFDGFNYTLYGDPNLHPDRSSSVDIGIDQRLWNSRVQLSATYFYTRLSQLIIFDTGINPPYGGYRNGGGGIASGFEFSSSVAATRRLQFNAAYTYTNSRQDTPEVPGVWQSLDIPHHQYSVYATERLTARVTAIFRYFGTSDYVSSIWGLGYRFPGAARAQAMLSYRRLLGEFRAIRFYGKVDNLSNQAYFQDGFRTPGATFTVGTQFEF